MIHHFDSEVAEKLGVSAAIIVANLAYLQANRKAQGGDKYYMDGRWWVHHTYESLAKFHPYFSVPQIKRIMKGLLEQGAVFHCTPDRWKRDSYWSVALEFTHSTKSHDGEYEIVPSQSTKSYSVLHDNNIEHIGRSPSNKFQPPTLEMVTDYCLERRNGVDPERFIDFYESKGWMIGKNKMKDWKAAVRTWARNQKDSNNNQSNQRYL